MPKIEQTIADVNVRSHTFKFIPPATTDSLEGAERLQRLPHRQVDRVGDRGAAIVAGVLAVAGRAVTGEGIGGLGIRD